MNGKIFTASVLAATMTFAAVAPALADGAASTRNILIGGAAAAVLVTNYNHKVRAKREQQREASRRHRELPAGRRRRMQSAKLVEADRRSFRSAVD